MDNKTFMQSSGINIFTGTYRQLITMLILSSILLIFNIIWTIKQERLRFSKNLIQVILLKTVQKAAKIYILPRIMQQVDELTVFQMQHLYSSS